MSSVKFLEEKQGYCKEQVDRYVGLLTGEYEKMQREYASMNEKFEQLKASAASSASQPAADTSELESMIRLLEGKLQSAAVENRRLKEALQNSSQGGMSDDRRSKAIGEAIVDAKMLAQQIVDNAKFEASKILHSAKEEAKGILADARQEVTKIAHSGEKEVRRLSGEKKRVLSEIGKIQEQLTSLFDARDLGGAAEDMRIIDFSDNE